ncbi:MAG TPA: hypothetical protein VFQ15_11240 [Jiangellaceae bacterium]|nr:hypothetical protein [Jiangellaceae bacterium]
MFVCTANSARSHLAAALWSRTTAIPGVSAGTHPATAIDVGAIRVAERHGLRLPRIRPKHLKDVATAGDFIVTVCDLAHEELGEKSDAHWSVPDPAPAATAAAFDAAYDDLSARVGELARLITVPA